MECSKILLIEMIEQGYDSIELLNVEKDRLSKLIADYNNRIVSREIEIQDYKNTLEKLGVEYGKQ